MLDSIQEGSKSDTVLVTIEELIDRAMGPQDANLIEFKLLEKILEILAKQLRILHQKVEIEHKIVKSPRKGKRRVKKEKEEIKEQIILEPRYPSGIDFVKRSQFELLVSAVKELDSVVVPKRLEQPEDINLLNERMKLIEESITEISERLTQLATAESVDEQVETMEKDETPLLAAKKEEDTVMRLPCVTIKDMKKALDDLKADITEGLRKTMINIHAMVERTQNIVKDAANKLNVVMNIESCITSLRTLVEECSKHLNGFGLQVETQIQNIEDEIEQFCQIIIAGLDKLKSVNNNAEREAIMAMIDGCEDMMIHMETIQHEHDLLETKNTSVNDEMCGLLDCMMIFEEEKAEHDDILNGLICKVEMSQLGGMLKMEHFAAARVDFKKRMDQCHERFQQSVSLWAAFIEVLKKTKNTKLDFFELLSERDAVQCQLQNLNHKIRILTDILGDPEMAMKSRKIDATCGICGESAIMDPCDVTVGLPPRLPPLRPPTGVPQTTMEPWLSEWMKPGPSENRHFCRRWCGGSHTVVDASKRLQLRIQMQAIPTEKFTEYAVDDVVYNMSKNKLLPCIKCKVQYEKNQGQNFEPDVTDVQKGDNTPENEHPMECTCPLIK